MLAPFDHQITAGKCLRQYEEFALVMDMGTGKSRPIVREFVYRIQSNLADDLVVIGPKGCYLNWIISPDEDEQSELDKWVEPELRERICIAAWRSGASKGYQTILNALLGATRPRVLVMNIEALNRPGAAREYLLTFCKGRRVIGVIDESTMIAHEEAQRTKWLLDHAGIFTTRRILSGLVAPESPLDLYSQYKWLDWRIIGQKTFWGFKNRYAITEKIDFRPKALRQKEDAEGKKHKVATVVVGFRNLDELNRKIMARSYRVEKSVLNLPPQVYEFYDVDLTEEQQRIYVEMRDLATAQLAEGVFSTASIKLDQLGKMQHILCGHVRQEDGSLVDIPENRTAATVEILKSYSGKAIIWAPYPQALRKIRGALQHEFGEDSTVGFWGETTLDERVDARLRIQRDEKTRFIVSNQSVGKFGNTWTACNLVIYYANSFDNEDRRQSEDRPHRIGQTKSVLYVDLRARGTLDERLIQVLRRKISISSTLQGDKFKQWLI